MLSRDLRCAFSRLQLFIIIWLHLRTAVPFLFLTDCMSNRQILETHMFIVNLKFRPPYLYETKKKKQRLLHLILPRNRDCEARSGLGFKVKKKWTICDIKDRLEASPVSTLSVRCEVWWVMRIPLPPYWTRLKCSLWWRRLQSNRSACTIVKHF